MSSYYDISTLDQYIIISFSVRTNYTINYHVYILRIISSSYIELISYLNVTDNAYILSHIICFHITFPHLTCSPLMSAHLLSSHLSLHITCSHVPLPGQSLEDVLRLVASAGISESDHFVSYEAFVLVTRILDSRDQSQKLGQGLSDSPVGPSGTGNSKELSHDIPLPARFCVSSVTISVRAELEYF